MQGDWTWNRVVGKQTTYCTVISASINMTLKTYCWATQGYTMLFGIWCQLIIWDLLSIYKMLIFIPLLTEDLLCSKQNRYFKIVMSYKIPTQKKEVVIPFTADTVCRQATYLWVGTKSSHIHLASWYSSDRINLTKKKS